MAIKQAIPSNTNSNKSLTFGNFKGVDFSSSPLEVSNSRAVFSKNMINENGANHKRKGYKLKRQDIIDYINLKNNCLLTISVISSTEDANKGTKSRTIYICRTERLSINVYSEYNFTETISINKEFNDDAIIKQFGDDKLLIIGFGKIILFNGKYFVDCETINNDFYIPRTTISINSDSEVEATRATFESANLLNPKRKNTLIGKKYLSAKLNIIPQVNSQTLTDFTITLTNEVGMIIKNESGVFEIEEGTYSYDITKDGYTYAVDGERKIVVDSTTIENSETTIEVIVEMTTVSE